MGSWSYEPEGSYEGKSWEPPEEVRDWLQGILHATHEGINAIHQAIEMAAMMERVRGATDNKGHAMVPATGFVACNLMPHVATKMEAELNEWWVLQRKHRPPEAPPLTNVVDIFTENDADHPGRMSLTVKVWADAKNKALAEENEDQIHNTKMPKITTGAGPRMDAFANGLLAMLEGMQAAQSKDKKPKDANQKSADDSLKAALADIEAEIQRAKAAADSSHDTDANETPPPPKAPPTDVPPTTDNNKTE